MSRKEFQAADVRAQIDAAKTDAEDALDIECADMDESAFDEALEAAGLEMVRDLESIANYHAGTVAHLSGGWRLWMQS